MVGIKVEYEIDNFSGLESINDWDIKAPNSRVKGVYFIYDKNRELIYIGKATSSVRTRLCQHLFTNTDDFFTLTKRDEYLYFAYSEINADACSFVEKYLISKFNPKFNKNHNDKFEMNQDWVEKDSSVSSEEEEYIRSMYLNL